MASGEEEGPVATWLKNIVDWTGLAINDLLYGSSEVEKDDRCRGSWRPHDRDGHGIEEEEEYYYYVLRVYNLLLSMNINQYLFTQRICQAVYIINRQFLKLLLCKYIENELNLQSHNSEHTQEYTSNEVYNHCLNKNYEIL